MQEFLNFLHNIYLVFWENAKKEQRESINRKLENLANITWFNKLNFLFVILVNVVVFVLFIIKCVKSEVKRIFLNKNNTINEIKSSLSLVFVFNFQFKLNQIKKRKFQLFLFVYKMNFLKR